MLTGKGRQYKPVSQADLRGDDVKSASLRDTSFEHHEQSGADVCCALRLCRDRRTNACASDRDGGGHTAAQTNDRSTVGGNTAGQSIREEFDHRFWDRADTLGHGLRLGDCCFRQPCIGICFPTVYRLWLDAMVSILSHCHPVFRGRINGWSIIVRNTSLNVRF